ncbi:hypothetical protein D5S17_01915 [Pseudonocardiaceae bacterium YIM PH 21723]|nr:hypothetical protein D5S17_01915 [Pseudonocardiaceae bacterium YIM PH 21723]
MLILAWLPLVVIVATGVVLYGEWRVRPAKRVAAQAYSWLLPVPASVQASVLEKLREGGKRSEALAVLAERADLTSEEAVAVLAGLAAGDEQPAGYADAVRRLGSRFPELTARLHVLASSHDRTAAIQLLRQHLGPRLRLITATSLIDSLITVYSRRD